MKYLIQFPNNTSFIVASSEDTKGVVSALTSVRGFIGFNGVIYNPKSFISVEKASDTDERYNRVCRKLDEVLF